MKEYREPLIGTDGTLMMRGDRINKIFEGLTRWGLGWGATDEV
jgi:hypothetical protein